MLHVLCVGISEAVGVSSRVLDYLFVVVCGCGPHDRPKL